MRYGITTDHDYTASHKRERLTIWSGGFSSNYEGEAYSLPGGNGYMVTLDHLTWTEKVKVTCPAPRTDENYVEVDAAINKALNEHTAAREAAKKEAAASRAARKCFWVDQTHQVPAGFEVNIVTENQDGYEVSGMIVPTSDIMYAQIVVRILNESLFGIAPEEATRIVMSSMFPAARVEPVSRHNWTDTIEGVFCIKCKALVVRANDPRTLPSAVCAD